ncbi:hypothetical protein LPJ66_009214, partial [Kickxella alabastrina]
TMMTDLDLDSKAILNGLVYLDQHNLLPPSAAPALGGQKHQQQKDSSKNANKTDDTPSAPDQAAADASKDATPQQSTGAARYSVAAPSSAPGLTPQQQQQLLPGMSPKTAAGHFSGAGPHAIATLKVETSAVLKELARFRACDDQTMSCFYCREWAQWVYRKQISPQATSTSVTAGGAGGAGAGSAAGGRKKKKQQQQQAFTISAHAGSSGGGPAGGSNAATDEAAAERERIERKRAARLRYSTIGDLCQNLRAMVAGERDWLLNASNVEGIVPPSRPGSPSPSVSSATSSNVPEQQGGKAAAAGGKSLRGKAAAAPAAAAAAPRAKEMDDVTGDAAKSALSIAAAAAGSSSSSSGISSLLIDNIVEEVTLWYEGYQFPLADVYEDLTFDFPPDAFPYDDNQDPLDPALLLPALQVTKTFISLPASNFPLLGNITSELIATHTYPTCQHTKADHPTPSELETQRLIFNSQLQKWRGEYKRSFEREMEPVWQITQLLLKSAQRIEAMRVRLFARGCRANREQFLQTIRNRTQPFAEFWTRVSEPYRTGKAATMTGPPAGSGADESSQADGSNLEQPASAGANNANNASASATSAAAAAAAAKRVRSKRGVGHSSNVKSQAQLADELDGLVLTHLDNLLEVSATWSRTFLESYYGVAREFARELETILGECITMCDRRAQGLKYPPPLTLQPQLEKARSAISCLLPHLEARIARIQEVVRERNADIFIGTEDVRAMWIEGSGSTVQTKLAKAAHKDFKKKLKRIEHQQQVGVIGWAMRELEHLLTAPDVAAVVADCLELLMTEAEILERAVGQVFVRKLEPTTEDLREQRQDIIDDFTEGLLTGREELAGIIGKLMLKEAWRILEANISLQRQKALLDGGGGGNGSGKGKKNKSTQKAAAAITAPAENGQAADSAAISATSTIPALPPQLASDQLSLADDDDLFNDDADSVAAKKRKKNKKKKTKKKKTKQSSLLLLAGASDPSSAQGVNDAASVVDDDYDGEDDEDNDGDQESEAQRIQDPHNQFAYLNLDTANNEAQGSGDQRSASGNSAAATNAALLETAKAPESTPAPAAVAVPAPAAVTDTASASASAAALLEPAPAKSDAVSESAATSHIATSAPAKKSEEQQQPLAQQQQHDPVLVQPKPQVPPTSKVPASGDESSGLKSMSAAAAATTRSRRNTNAARYVPGVGFVSDDGVNTTSPQMVTSNINSSFRGSANGTPVSTVPATAALRSSAAASTLGIQTSSARGSANGHMSPMNAAARLVSPASRPQSPLVISSTSASVVAASDKRPAVPVLDKESLAALQSVLITVPQDQLEKKLSGLAYENLVTLTAGSVIERRKIQDKAVQMYKSVSSVMDSYEDLQTQVVSFKSLYEDNNGETMRLSSLLAQAAQEAQGWRDQCEQLQNEVAVLRLSKKTAEAASVSAERHSDGALGGDTRRSSVANGVPSASASAGSASTNSAALPTSMGLKSMDGRNDLNNMWMVGEMLHQQMPMPMDAQGWM